MRQWPRARLLAPVLVGVALCAGNAMAQEHLLARSPAPHASVAIELPIWRTISLGTAKGVNAYRNALDAEGIKIGDSADEILGRPAFFYARAKAGGARCSVCCRAWRGSGCCVPRGGLPARKPDGSRAVSRRGRTAIAARVPQSATRRSARYRNGAGLDLCRRAHNLGPGELRDRSRAHRRRWAIGFHGAARASLRVCPSGARALGGRAVSDRDRPELNGASQTDASRSRGTGCAPAIGCLAVLGFAVIGGNEATAQTYPSRPITIIVPFAAGGTTDVIARILGEHMSRTLGQQLIVENVVGAGGTTGSVRAMRASPDGYTV